MRGEFKLPRGQARQRGRRQGRKTEGRSNPLLKRTKQPGPANEESLTELQVETKRNLTRQRLKTGRACRMREVLQEHLRRPPPSNFASALALHMHQAPARTASRYTDATSPDRRLLRAPVHQRRAQGRRQRHPERQTTGERLPQHGLLRHHDLPDLRQTRPQSRHHHLTITHHKQRIAKKMTHVLLYIKTHRKSHIYCAILCALQ